MFENPVSTHWGEISTHFITGYDNHREFAYFFFWGGEGER